MHSNGTDNEWPQKRDLYSGDIIIINTKVVHMARTDGDEQDHLFHEIFQTHTMSKTVWSTVPCNNLLAKWLLENLIKCLS